MHTLISSKSFIGIKSDFEFISNKTTARINLIVNVGDKTNFCLVRNYPQSEEFYLEILKTNILASQMGLLRRAHGMLISVGMPMQMRR